jgi:hypothetical protein
LVELSCHETSIRLSDTATAAVLEGAFTFGTDAAVEGAGMGGSTNSLPSQPMTKSARRDPLR